MRSDCYRARRREFFCSGDGAESTRSYPSPTVYFKTVTTELHSAKLTDAILRFFQYIFSLPRVVPFLFAALSVGLSAYLAGNHRTHARIGQLAKLQAA